MKLLKKLLSKLLNKSSHKSIDQNHPNKDLIISFSQLNII